MQQAKDEGEHTDTSPSLGRNVTTVARNAPAISVTARLSSNRCTRVRSIVSIGVLVNQAGLKDLEDLVDLLDLMGLIAKRNHERTNRF